jgi:DNA polymerase elongation subunit (family B)
MFLARKYDIGKKYVSYGLKAIINHEGLEKKDRMFYDAGEIRHNYENPIEWDKIKAYAIDDADDAMSLFDLMIPSLFYFTQSVSKTFQQMVNSATGSQINNIMVRSYIQDLHSVAKADESVPFEGALSLGIPGQYKNCVRWDAASLYPSIMRQHKLYNIKKDPRMYFIEITNYFALERLKNKKLAKETNMQYYKDLEGSQKVGANSLYGFLGAPGLNYNYPVGAAKITTEGRNLLKRMIYWASGKTIEDLRNEDSRIREK